MRGAHWLTASYDEGVSVGPGTSVSVGGGVKVGVVEGAMV
jgi:hypothetical protein